MAQTDIERTECRNPVAGRAPVRIPTWKYEAVRRAILAAVPRGQPGTEFRALPGLVAQALSAGERGRLGSVSWHTTVVKLHMEALGELERLPGGGPQRLIRTH